MHTHKKYNKFNWLVHRQKSDSRYKMTQAADNTIMLSFYVLIGFHKVPELLLALFCQELTKEWRPSWHFNVYFFCLYCLRVNNEFKNGFYIAWYSEIAKSAHLMIVMNLQAYRTFISEIICFQNVIWDVKRTKCWYSWAVFYLASSSRGVSAHFVVRVVVIALESAPADMAGNSKINT